MQLYSCTESNNNPNQETEVSHARSVEAICKENKTRENKVKQPKIFIFLPTASKGNTFTAQVDNLK